jgi:2-polyprenyl-6-hydroxyphenyl methylase/3-demethylubiquinone-9 3-methyltransferase
MPPPRRDPRATVDEAEVARFARLAAEWWDPHGSMAALHKFNPVRLAFVRDRVCAHFGRDPRRLDCLSGLRILDIGCGGGILAEPLARLGGSVVGADPSERNIAVARQHAERAGVTVDYRCTTAEALADAGERFDVVLAMEVVEHVTDVAAFIARCAAMVRDGGLMLVATINRTFKSYALAIIGAEYILRWLPRGTHRWDKFVTPQELERALTRSGLAVVAETGVVYNLFGDRWQLSDDMDVNYMLVAVRAAAPPGPGHGRLRPAAARWRYASSLRVARSGGRTRTRALSTGDGAACWTPRNSGFPSR